MRTFISPTPNHMNLGQQTIANVSSLVAAQHQQQQQSHQQLSQQSSAANLHHPNSSMPPSVHSTHTLQTKAANSHHTIPAHVNQSQLSGINLNVGCLPLRQTSVANMPMIPVQKVCLAFDKNLYFFEFCYAMRIT